MPGGGGMDPNDPALDEASEGATEFQEEARENFSDLTEAIDAVNNRVKDLEDRQLGPRVAALEDRRPAKQSAPDEEGSS